MLEMRTDFVARPDQTATVNSQLIIRSELLALPHQELCQRIREEVEENPALELEVTPLDAEVPMRVVDGYGHLAGSRVLKEIGQTITQSLGKDDFLIKYGGDEYVLLLLSQRLDLLF